MRWSGAMWERSGHITLALLFAHAFHALIRASGRGTEEIGKREFMWMAISLLAIACGGRQPAVCLRCSPAGGYGPG